MTKLNFLLLNNNNPELILKSREQSVTAKSKMRVKICDIPQHKHIASGTLKSTCLPTQDVI